MVTGKSTKDTVKTIVQGMPVVAVYPWLLTRVLFAAHAASGATRIRHSLRPLMIEGGSFPTTRTFRAARTKTLVSVAPANAGAHNHRVLCLQAVSTPSTQNREAAAYGSLRSQGRPQSDRLLHRKTAPAPSRTMRPAWCNP